MKFRFRAAAAVFVSLFGLTSCNKDPETLADPWSPTAPEIHEEHGRTSRPIHEGTTPIDPAARIFFRELEDATALGAQTECQGKAGRHVSVIDLTGLDSVSVLSLLPPEIWRRLDYSSLADTTCSFSLTARNEIGSTIAWSSLKVALGSLDEAANLSLRLGVAGQEPGLDFPELFETAADRYHLVCETFDISFGAETKEVPAEAAGTSQRCRLITEEASAKSHLSEIRFSRVATVRFPLPATEIHPSLTGLDAIELTGTAIGHSRLFEVTIKNTSLQNTAFRFPERPDETVELSVVTGEPGQVFRSFAPLKGKLLVSVSGSSKVLQQAGWIVFEVPPGASVVLKGQLDIDTVCERLPPNYLAGFLYSLSRPAVLEQFKSWNSANPIFNGAAVNAWTLENGWIPHRNYVHQMGRAERPEIVTSPASTLLDPCSNEARRARRKFLDRN